MKNMSKARESMPCPPPATYKARITSAEATTSQSSGTAMIKMSGEITEPEQYAGATFFDNILTDGEAKGAGFGKKKLRGLGQDVDTEGYEKPDEQIAQEILGVETYAEFGNEQIYDKNPATDKYDKPRWDVVNGKQIPVMKLVVKNYLGSVNTAPATPPAAFWGAALAQPAAATAKPAEAPKPATAAAVPPWKKAQAAAAAK